MMFAKRTARLKSSAIREILKVTSRPEVISFAGGLPSPDLFPIEEISRASQRVLSKYGAASLQYSVTEGLPELREKIAGMIDPEKQFIGPQNIIVTHGSQQGLDLISKLLIDKGDAVFTENPTYLGALQPFRLFDADIVPLPCDDHGLRIDALTGKLKDRMPKFIYLMPNFQNPTGVTLSVERRPALIRTVKENNLILVEDDPYGDLAFDGERPSALFMLARHKDFIYLGTFSKTIAPGLRVAFMAADEEIIGKLAVIKQGTDLQTNTLGQYIVNEYLESGCYAEHIKLITETYRRRRDLMLDAMKEHFPSSVKWGCPSGGMFLWVTLPDECDAKSVLLKCLERNVAFVPGQEFFPDGSGINTMRLNFSNASAGDIGQGIRRMGEVLTGMNVLK